MNQIRTKLLLSLGLLSSGAFAQTIESVYPRFVVAGAETPFIAYGNDLPPPKRGLGIKHSIGKAAVCTNARNQKPQTKKRYYFSCTLSSQAKLAKLQIVNVGKKSGTKVLWDGQLQILDGPPSIQTVSVTSESLDGQSQILCIPKKPCLIITGKLEPGQSINIEVQGRNLPASLQWSVGGCRSISDWGNPSNTTAVKFDCNSVIAGQDTLRILTAPKSEGGVEIYTAPLPISLP